jgi:hypothetical protein
MKQNLTEVIQLPSKGLVYSKDNILSKGEVEMKYMSAKEEDILTNINYIKNGTVIDKLLEELIVTPINLDDLLIGDKNAILFAARILGYGKDYTIKFFNNETGQNEQYTVDLTKLEEKEVNFDLFTSGLNEFYYTLPESEISVSFKLLTKGDENKIEQEIKGLKKVFPLKSFDATTRLKYIITSVGGSRDIKTIRDFIDNDLRSIDSRYLREYYNRIMPDINTKITIEKDGYIQEDVEIPLGIDFFWPDTRV